MALQDLTEIKAVHINTDWNQYILASILLPAKELRDQCLRPLICDSSVSGAIQSTESRRAAVDVFLKGAGYLDCAFRHVLPHLSAELRESLPVDLSEGVLRALSLHALGQGVDIQLGMAIDSAKATMAVKRRLACEMVKYWQQIYLELNSKIKDAVISLAENCLKREKDRVSHYLHSDSEQKLLYHQLLGCLAGVEMILKDVGYPVKLGSGVAAASSFLQNNLPMIPSRI